MSALADPILDVRTMSPAQRLYAARRLAAEMSAESQQVAEEWHDRFLRKGAEPLEHLRTAHELLGYLEGTLRSLARLHSAGLRSIDDPGVRLVAELLHAAEQKLAAKLLRESAQAPTL